MQISANSFTGKLQHAAREISEPNAQDRCINKCFKHWVVPVIVSLAAAILTLPLDATVCLLSTFAIIPLLLIKDAKAHLQNTLAAVILVVISPFIVLANLFGAGIRTPLNYNRDFFNSENSLLHLLKRTNPGNSEITKVICTGLLKNGHLQFNQDQKIILTLASCGDPDAMKCANEFSEQFDSNEPPLIWAIRSGVSEDKVLYLVNLILPCVSNVDETRFLGKTALMVACEKGFTSVVERLLKADAKPDLKTKQHHTALMFACAQGHKDLVIKMLEVPFAFKSEDMVDLISLSLDHPEVLECFPKVSNPTVLGILMEKTTKMKNPEQLKWLQCIECLVKQGYPLPAGTIASLKLICMAVENEYNDLYVALKPLVNNVKIDKSSNFYKKLLHKYCLKNNEKAISLLATLVSPEVIEEIFLKAEKGTKFKTSVPDYWGEFKNTVEYKVTDKDISIMLSLLKYVSPVHRIPVLKEAIKKDNVELIDKLFAANPTLYNSPEEQALLAFPKDLVTMAMKKRRYHFENPIAEKLARLGCPIPTLEQINTIDRYGGGCIGYILVAKKIEVAHNEYRAGLGLPPLVSYEFPPWDLNYAQTHGLANAAINDERFIEY